MEYLSKKTESSFHTIQFQYTTHITYIQAHPHRHTAAEATEIPKQVVCHREAQSQNF